MITPYLSSLRPGQVSNYVTGTLIRSVQGITYITERLSIEKPETDIVRGAKMFVF